MASQKHYYTYYWCHMHREINIANLDFLFFIPSPFPLRVGEAHPTLGHMLQTGSGVRLFQVEYPFNYTQVLNSVKSRL